MRVQQLTEGTYIKTLTPVETKLYERIKEEEKERIEFSYRLQAQHNKLNQVIDAISSGIGEINNTLNGILTNIGVIEDRLRALEASNGDSTANCYTKDEVDAMLAAYYVEEISHQYGRPMAVFFDATPLDKKFTGYAHFPWARLKKTPDTTFSADTMRRYSISIYTSAAKQLTFPIIHEDYMAIYHNDEEIALLSGSNIGGQPENVVIYLNPGWNILQFLLAGRNTSYTFDIGLDLAKEVDAVACLNTGQLVIGSKNIGVGCVLPQHLNAGEEYSFLSGHFTKTGSPAVKCGSEASGAIMIGGSVLEYTDNILTINCGMKVNGLLEWQGSGENAVKTAHFLPGIDICLPPATTVNDTGAYKNSAAYIPSGTTSNIIGYTSEENEVCPGTYRLYARMRPETNVTGTIGIINVISSDNMAASITIEGNMLDKDKYSVVQLSFSHTGNELSIQLIPTGITGIFLDYIYITLG